MENLLVRRVWRGSDKLLVGRASEVFDMGYHGRVAIRQSSFLLTSSNIADVGRYTGIYDDIVFPGIIIDAQPPENDESSTGVDLLRKVSKDRPQGR